MEFNGISIQTSLESLIKEKKLDKICNDIRNVFKANEITYQQAIEIFEYMKCKLKYTSKII